jgi:hypothetical protein
MGRLPGTLLMPSPPESTDGVEAVVGAIEDDLGTCSSSEREPARGCWKPLHPCDSGCGGCRVEGSVYVVTHMVEMMTLTFEKQVEGLLARGLAEDDAALRAATEAARPVEPVERSVLVLASDVVPLATAASKIERRGRPVLLGQMEPEDLETFQPIDAVRVPKAPAYLAIDVDLGAGSRNVRPEDACVTSSPQAGRR